MTLPLQKNQNCKITFFPIELEKKFPFPWKMKDFINVFPESYLQIPEKIINPKPNIEKFDLIILCYQVWFLSPSIPIISFLKSKLGENLLQNTPVITLSASRNMWMLSQEKIKKILAKTHSELLGNIALVDKHNNYISVMTILGWMKTGQKKFSKFLPSAGVSQQDIEKTTKFGEIILQYLTEKISKDKIQQNFLKLNTIEIKPFLVRMEKTGNKIFKIWANFIIKKRKNRNLYLSFFKYYLFFAIWFISPIVLILFHLTTPFFHKKRKKEIEYLKNNHYKENLFDYE